MDYKLIRLFFYGNCNKLSFLGKRSPLFPKLHGRKNLGIFFLKKYGTFNSSFQITNLFSVLICVRKQQVATNGDCPRRTFYYCLLYLWHALVRAFTTQSSFCQSETRVIFLCQTSRTHFERCAHTPLNTVLLKALWNDTYVWS